LTAETLSSLMFNVSANISSSSSVSLITLVTKSGNVTATLMLARGDGEAVSEGLTEGEVETDGLRERESDSDCTRGRGELEIVEETEMDELGV